MASKFIERWFEAGLERNLGSTSIAVEDGYLREMVNSTPSVTLKVGDRPQRTNWE